MKHGELGSLIAKKNNGFYLTVFFIFFGTAILLSLVARGITLYNNAQFTGNSIMLLVVTEKNSHIMRLDKATQQLSLLKIVDVAIDTDDISTASIRTGVPIHAAIIIKNPTADIRDIVTVGGIIKLLMSNGVSLIQLNEYDAVNIAYAAQKIPSDRTTVKEIKNYIDDRSIISQIDHELYELFRDPEVINERISIEVVNATNISGLATSVAQMLENGGYTVVAIRSSQVQKSMIQTNNTETITAKNVKKIFGFPQTSLGKNAVADIRIVIGEDTEQ
ncbi:MAG TPA: LytR C-terminal domain-containing protein [Candidatus Levybacteria bacterium]|nr:LytR C-terminal domain-containing protein [Candidatus Levybacteria bacterium]